MINYKWDATYYFSDNDDEETNNKTTINNDDETTEERYTINSSKVINISFNDEDNKDDMEVSIASSRYHK